MELLTLPIYRPRNFHPRLLPASLPMTHGSPASVVRRSSVMGQLRQKRPGTVVAELVGAASARSSQLHRIKRRCRSQSKVNFRIVEVFPMSQPTPIRSLVWRSMRMDNGTLLVVPVPAHHSGLVSWLLPIRWPVTPLVSSTPASTNWLNPALTLRISTILLSAT